MVTSHFSTKVEIRPFLRMRNASGHNYWNSSFIMDVAMGRYHVPQNAFLVTLSNLSLLLAFH